MKKSKKFTLRVRGRHALFTRPEFKSERFSYHVPTHSGMRGVLSAILWKPAISWHIHKVHVLKPIEFTSFKRNEVSSKAVAPSKDVIKNGGTAPVLYADRDRVVRHTVALKDVDYLVECSFSLTKRAGEGDNVRKFEEMFTRRVTSGQSFHHPYLGCREFAARVSFMEEEDHLTAIPETKDLGVMLWDIAHERTKKDGVFEPIFFHAHLENGVVTYPQSEGEARESLLKALP